MAMPNLWDAQTQAAMADLFGTRHKVMPTREEYGQQLHRWLALADKRHTPAAIEAVQARRVANLKSNQG